MLSIFELDQSLRAEIQAGRRQEALEAFRARLSEPKFVTALASKVQRTATELFLVASRNMEEVGDVIGSGESPNQQNMGIVTSGLISLISACEGMKSVCRVLSFIEDATPESAREELSGLAKLAEQVKNGADSLDAILKKHVQVHVVGSEEDLQKVMNQIQAQEANPMVSSVVSQTISDARPRQVVTLSQGSKAKN